MTTRTTDRPGVPGVPSKVTSLPRRWTLAAALVVALVPACGKDKKGSTTPGGGAGGSGEVSGGGELPSGGGEPGGTGGGGEVGGGEGEGGEPGLRPPGVDLTPEQQKQQVALHLKRGQSAIRGGANDPNLAISEAQLALQADETSVDAMVLLAHANYIKGYDDQAEDILDKTFKRGGENHKEAHFVMGLVFDKTKRPDKAMVEYEKATKLDPNYSSALMNLGVHYLRNKRWADAVTLYERLTNELKFQSAAVWTNLGSAYRGRSADFNATDVTQRNQLLAKAEASYKKALAARANYANSTFNLGLLYLDADPYPEGTGDMDRLKRLGRAKTYFDQYRGQPGADMKLADDLVAVVQKLIDKETLNRQKAAEREAKKKVKEAADKKKAEEKAKKGEKLDDDEGFQ
jgi:Tfp pilus assembly protein PilF